ncbi:hypothetical protein ACT2FY_27090 [Paraburkholderia fungorum]|uniref:hypothetical protein n=1 Tax=Paraburkholderia fungorum TaxID=134537 RepID=UPI00402BE245
MAYNYLDEFAGLDGAFTIAYRITDDGGDPWTARFNRFKAKDKEARLGGGQVFATAVPALMQAIGANPADSIFIPALSSSETVCTEKGFVSRLAKWTAAATGALYAPGVLRKQEHRPIHGIYDAGSRSAELDKAAYVSAPVGRTTVFIFDDLITRGGTLSRIAQAVRAANPGVLRVYGVALGKTERRAYWGTLTNDHVPPEQDRQWKYGERLYRDWKEGRKG